MSLCKTLLLILLLTSLVVSSELHIAVKNGDAELCKALLGNGKRKRSQNVGNRANVNAQNLDGDTPLMLSILYDEKECFDLILEHNDVNVNFANDGRTALHVAALNGNEDMCVALLEKGADINAQDRDGTTPLMDAIEIIEHIKSAKMILRRSPNLEIQNDDGETALHLAAQANEKMCGALLGKGADVNAQNVDGDTPLMLSIYMGKIKCAKMILRKSPDLEIQNEDGETAFDYRYAFGNRRGEIIAILGIVAESGIAKAVEKLAWEERNSFLKLYKTVQGFGKEKKGATIYNIKM